MSSFGRPFVVWAHIVQIHLMLHLWSRKGGGNRTVCPIYLANST